ncbi:MAG TPA: TadE family protein [Thermoanaerobaculia bacterium]
MPGSDGERGSALVEAAILFPCLVLLLHWSVALTDVSLLKLAASEAARFALWETTVWKSPARIQLQLEQRFAARAARGSGLLLFPDPRALRFRASVASVAPEPFKSGAAPSIPLPGSVGRFASAAAASIPASIGDALRRFRFEARGAADVRAGVSIASHRSSILAGGNLPGRPGGGDFERPASLARFALEAPLPSDRPLRLVFETWKAWPRPAPSTQGGPPQAEPDDTYRVVERQVGAQVGRIAFAGIRERPWFARLEALVGGLAGASASRTLLGGQLPELFATGRLDDATSPGPITILPPGPADASFVPNTCRIRGAAGRCANTRAGDVLASSPAPPLSGAEAFTDGEDVPRSTVPFRVQGQYWTRTGGSDGSLGPAVQPYPAAIARDNAYVTSWTCRGHYFAGSTRPEEADVRRRYRPPCR